MAQSLAVPPERLHLLDDADARGVVRRVSVQYRLRVSRRLVDPDEIDAAALRGLAQAATRYNPARGVPFHLYATPRIEGAVLDELRAQDWLSRGDRKAAKAAGETRNHLTGGALDLVTGEDGDGRDAPGLRRPNGRPFADDDAGADGGRLDASAMVAWVLGQLPAAAADLLRGYYLNPARPRLIDLHGPNGPRTKAGTSLALKTAREHARRLLQLRFGAQIGNELLGAV